jgi:hypothetical protein
MLPHENGVKLGLGCGWLGVGTFEIFGVRHGMATMSDLKSPQWRMQVLTAFLGAAGHAAA